MHENTGRDWIGDSLLFDSEMKILSVDRNSRRAPDFTQEIINASRIGYLFHKNFYYGSSSSNTNSPGDSDMFFHTFSKLFGAEFLDYDRFDLNPYTLFLPKEKHPGFDKSRWTLQSSNPIYLGASADHNLGLRGIGRDAYWASDRIPEGGCFYKTIFIKPKRIQHILLFHGTKYSDRTKENSIFVTLENGLTYNAGSLTYRPEIRSSFIELFSPVTAKEIEIRVQPTPDESWWTIFEIWFY